MGIWKGFADRDRARLKALIRHLPWQTIMGFIIILPFTCGMAYCIFALRRWLAKDSLGEKWLRNYRHLTLAGAILGMVFAFVIHYQLPLVKVEGFPFPSSYSRRDTIKDAWISSNIPGSVRLTVEITDVLCGVLLCLAPLAAAAFMKENRTPLPGQENTPAPRP